MRVRALQTVYNRAEGKEYHKGQKFETEDRAARVMLKLRKVEVVADDSRFAGKKVEPNSETPNLLTANMKAEADPSPESGAAGPRRYRRRDLRPEE